jgi:LPS-assembly protein
MNVIRRQTFRPIRLLTLRRLVAGIVMALCALLGHPPDLHASDDEAAANDPWQINADKIDYDQRLDTYVAEGHVVVSRKGKELSADTVHLNQKDQEALAIGNVRLVSGKDILSGRELRLNLASETGEITDGSLFIFQNHLYLSGDLIRKTGPQTFTADRITVTACDGPDPDWKITGQDLKVTIEGYGFAKHTALWAGNVPLLYSPYLIFPVKLKRQSGLLMPEIGYSERKGGQYLQPLYWAINDHSDATLYAHYMSERGVRTGIEYRYMLSDRSMGALFAEGFTDNQIDDGTQDASEQWGYEDDAVLRPNDDRYWVRMKHDQDLFGGLTAKLDLDVVSDQDYLHEFNTGFNGFNATQDYFRNTFGRDIDDEIDSVRLNRLNVNRSWNHYTFNSDLRWYDDVIKRRQGARDDTLRQMPAITFDGAQQPVGNGPLYFDLASSYVYHYRINGTSGQRVDLYPRLYLPMQLFNALTVAPSVGMRATSWYLYHDEEAPEETQAQFYRTLYDVKIDTSTEFYRLFNGSMDADGQIKHSITPQVVYEYIPDTDQSDLPELDDADRIERTNLITYSLTNTLTARSAKKNSDGQTDLSYHTFLRFKLAQSFDINKDNDNDPQPFSDVAAELDITPARYIRLDADAAWSIYDNEVTTFSSALTLFDSRSDSLTADYRYSRESSPGAENGVQAIGVTGALKVNDRWRLRGTYERNLYDHKDIESSFGFSYQAQCWGVDFDYTVEEDDRSYEVMFHLLSFGSISQ